MSACITTRWGPESGSFIGAVIETPSVSRYGLRLPAFAAGSTTPRQSRRPWNRPIPPAWYGRVSEHLYQYGLERPSKQVIEDFLGLPVSPQAILDDMERALAVAD
jgi:hypothetical protein